MPHAECREWPRWLAATIMDRITARAAAWLRRSTMAWSSIRARPWIIECDFPTTSASGATTAALGHFLRKSECDLLLMNGAVHLCIEFPSDEHRPPEVVRPVSAFEPPVRRFEKRRFGEILRAAGESLSAAMTWRLLQIVAAWRGRGRPTAAAAESLSATAAQSSSQTPI
jgi:hypothetical protein